ncbi:hypothetical protein GCM10009530_18950 [Microbispora corallina]|uniref:HNH nuclease domain-containing protein n=2 Tax=Microbispora corallina TaxID=83302 RepID=A0ABQ4FUD9_9ACTN|nr:hypothetical protein Mco01_14460 [Microbispora corallina]
MADAGPYTGDGAEDDGHRGTSDVPSEALVAEVRRAAMAVAAGPVPLSGLECAHEAEQLIFARDRLSAAIAARVGRVHGTGQARSAGHASTRAWLRSVGGMSRSGAGQALTLATELARLPLLRERFAAGAAAEGVVAAICGAVEGLSDEQTRLAEPILLRMAERAGAGEVARAGRYLRSLLDTDRAESEARADEAGRFLLVRDSVLGGVEGEFRLPREAGARLRALLDAYARPRAEGDDRPLQVRNADALIGLLEQRIGTELLVLVNAESLPADIPEPPHMTEDIEDIAPVTDAVGDGSPEPSEGWEKAARRQAEARRARRRRDRATAADRPDHPGDEPMADVRVGPWQGPHEEPQDAAERADPADPPGVSGQLPMSARRGMPGRLGTDEHRGRPESPYVADTSGAADEPAGFGVPGVLGLPGVLTPTGQVLPVSDIRRLARSSTLIRLVMNADGQVLDMGRKVRLATPAQRRAVLARYATCWVDGCPLPATMCQIDHVDDWSNGGRTDLDRLGPACQFHNRDRYRYPGRYRRRRVGVDRWAFTRVGRYATNRDRQ